MEPQQGQELGHCPLGASMMNLPGLLTLHPTGPQCHPTGVGAHRCMAGLCGPQLSPLCPTDPEKHD